MMLAMEFRYTQLSNGLTVVAEVNPDVASAAVGFFVRTGSRDETKEIAGVSHFLEHMMFKGNDRRSALDMSRAFDEIGAQYNANTSEEKTVYYGAVLPEFQDAMVDLLCDVLQPVIREADFDVEKQVVLDEIARYEDMPSYKIYEKLMATYFRGHPLGNSVLGTGESVTALTREQMKAYFKTRYSPGNIVITGAGNVDFDALVSKVAERCGHWQPCEVTRERPPAPGVRDRNIITDKSVVRQHLAMMSPGPSLQDDDREIGQLVTYLIGSSTGSRLYYALIDPAIADEAYMTYGGMDSIGGLITYCSCDPDRSAKVLDIVQKEYSRFMDGGPTDVEMAAAKNKITSRLTFGSELPMDRLMSVGNEWSYCGRYLPVEEDIDKFFSISRNNVMDLVRRYDLNASALVTLGPIEML